MVRNTPRGGVISPSIRTEDHGYAERVHEEDSKAWKPLILPPTLYPATLVFSSVLPRHHLYKRPHMQRR
jgi:hypothetical protein